jgi:small subunit ribosomal protein S16
MVKIRLSRAGAKKRPFYRIVAIDERARRDGRPLEYLGTYNPVATPKLVDIKTERVEHWVGQGAQLSDAVAGLMRLVKRGAAAAAASNG